MTEQPRFWLKVTPAYVVENFEALLRYVYDYNYSTPESNDSDFNVTVDCLCTVARDIIDRASQLSAEGKMEWPETDVRQSIRIVAAAMLSEHKRGRACHDYILGLIRMLLLFSDVPFSYRRQFTTVIRNCALHSPVTRVSLHFTDILPERFYEATLCARIANIEFGVAESRCAVFEGLGSVVFTSERVDIAPVNIDSLEKCHSELSQKISLDCGVSVVERKAKKVVADIEAVNDLFPRLVNEFNSVKPSAVKKLKDYTAGDILDVVITEVNGIKVLCESCDPDYNKVSGKILVDRGALGIPRDLLFSQLKAGDILPACYKTAPGYEFVISHSEDDDFTESYAEYYTGETLGAVFNGPYQFGSRWLTECGLSINILESAFDRIKMADHNHNGAQLKVRIKECRRDGKNNLVCNGEVLPESEQLLDDVDESQFREAASRRLAQGYIEFFSGVEYPAGDKNSGFVCAKAPVQAVDTLGLLILKTGDGSQAGSTFSRLCNMAVASLLLNAAGRGVDSDIARREFDYLGAIAAFSMGESPISLTFNPSPEVEAFPHTQVEKHIIEVLRGYVESHYELKTSDLLIGEQFSLVEELVRASNILIDKIDVVELSRIKKQIASKLGVADVYRDLNHNRTFYGMESDSLEFKISCARPPENRRTGSERADVDVQRFNILRTVCAFLNAQSGGDLLIGVGDDGYAAGLENDLDILSRYHLIAEPNIDRLGVYVKNQIDTAFVSNDGSARGNAITAGCVTITAEESDDHKQVLRVRVTPYPYDVVRIDPKYCPADCKDVYIRSSATSMSLDKDGVRNTRIRKLNALDKNEAKLARILEAIDNRKVLALRNYHSHSGLTDRNVEPHRLVLGQSALQAFDHSSRQMRLFRLSRISEIEIKEEKWKYAAKHRTLRVDIFGMMESDSFPGEIIRLKMTDFALMLLREEHPFDQDSDLVKIERNNGADSKKYPWIVSLTVFHPAGYSRFLNGLPELIQRID